MLKKILLSFLLASFANFLNAQDIPTVDDVNKNELAQLKVEFEEMKQMNDLHLEQQEVLKEEMKNRYKSCLIEKAELVSIN